MVGGFIAQAAFWATSLFLAELAVLGVVKKDEGGFKLGPADWYRESNLEHYQKVITVTAVGILTVGVVAYLLNYVLYSPVFGFIQGFSPIAAVAYTIALFLAVVVIGTYHWREKEPDKRLGKIVAAIVVLSLIAAHLRYGIFNGLL